MGNVTICDATRRFRFDSVLQINSHISEVPRLRTHVGKHLDLLRYPEGVRFQICLALDEALANAIEHGNLRGQQFVEVGMNLAREVAIFQVTDFGGQPFNPDYFAGIATVKRWGMGGRGLLLIRELMDEVYFFFHPGEKTTLVMIKQRDAEVKGPSAAGSAPGSADLAVR